MARHFAGEVPTTQSDSNALHFRRRHVPYVRVGGYYPCCKQRAFFRAIESVPHEVYERTCSRCGARWSVDRVTLREGNGRRIDRCEWICIRGVR